MSTLHRHLIRELLAVFAVVAIATLSLLTLTGGIKEAVQKGFPLHVVVQLLPYLIPEILCLTLPAAILFAVCQVVGRMAAANELVALRSLGISPLRVLWPVLGVAYVASISTFWLYEACACWSRPNVRRVAVTSISDIAYGTLQVEKAFATREMSISVRDVRQRRLVDPIITFNPKDDSPAIVLSAREVALDFDQERRALRFACTGATLDIPGRATVHLPDSFRHYLEMPPWELSADQLSPAGLPLRAISQQKKWESDCIAQIDGQLNDAATAALPDQRLRLENERKFHQQRLYRLTAEPQRRLANGFGCFCFALVGAAAAMWWRSDNTAATFFLCFLPILLVYYPLIVTGENLARAGVCPLLTVWLADAVVGMAGVVMLYRLSRR